MNVVLTQPGLSDLPATAGSPSPALFVGPIGTGRHTHARLLQAAQEGTADPPPEQSADVRTLVSSSLPELVRAVFETTEHLPAETRYKHLCLRNLHRYSKHSLDTLLKVMESPPAHLRVTATARSLDHLPPAIVSRFRIWRVRPLSRDALAEVLESKETLRPYRAALDARGSYPWSSPAQLALHTRYGFDAAADGLLFHARVGKLEATLSNLVDELDRHPVYPLEDLMDLFLSYLLLKWESWGRMNEGSDPIRRLRDYSQPIWAQAAEVADVIGRPASLRQHWTMRLRSLLYAFATLRSAMEPEEGEDA